MWLGLAEAVVFIGLFLLGATIYLGEPKEANECTQQW
jgi:hypothetical protein